jgi:hypothetical protein
LNPKKFISKAKPVRLVKSGLCTPKRLKEPQGNSPNKTDQK